MAKIKGQGIFERYKNREKTPKKIHQPKQQNYSYRPEKHRTRRSLGSKLRRLGLGLALVAALSIPLDQYTGIPGYIEGKIIKTVKSHSENGQYWQAIHERDAFKAKIQNRTPEKHEENKDAYPDTDFIREFPATETNEISIESDDTNYPIYRKARTI